MEDEEAVYEPYKEVKHAEATDARTAVLRMIRLALPLSTGTAQQGALGTL